MADAPDADDLHRSRSMSRPLAGALVAIVLIAGLGLGVVAGSIIGASPAASSVAVVESPSAPPTASSAPAPSTSLEPSSVPTPSPTATPVPTPTPAPTPVLVPAPLTGVPVSPKVAQRHVIAVMIDDLYAARPQSGLAEASVVWQAPAEGGIPRYMALFQEGDPPAVGPVRSARLYFIAWAAEWNTVYVHAGGSPQAKQLLSSSKGSGKVVYNADALRWEGRYLWRIKTRFAPHNLYTDGKHLRSLVKKVAPDADLSLRPDGGTILVPYSYNKIKYTYDRKTNTYKRSVSVEGKQVDAATKVRIAPKNVVIMFMHFAPLNDGSHKNRLEADFTGSGVAYIATNGKTIKGTWKKKSMTAPTRFYDKDGNQVTLTIGQTFVQVVPRGTKVTIKDGTVPAAS
jgi:Protein of unknown function (DUF3048) N-terminal domain/Protein of unknown function (DUF3048) C-terminal domain